MVFIANIDIYSNPCARNHRQTLSGLARFFGAGKPIKPRKAPAADSVPRCLLADEPPPNGIEIQTRFGYSRFTGSSI